MALHSAATSVPPISPDLTALLPLGTFSVPPASPDAHPVEVIPVNCVLVPVGRVREIRDSLQILLLLPYGMVTGRIVRREVRKITQLLVSV